MNLFLFPTFQQLAKVNLTEFKLTLRAEFNLSMQQDTMRVKLNHVIT